MRDGIPEQQIDGNADCSVEEVDLSDVSPTDTEIELVARDALDEEFDVSVGPIFKVKIVRLSDSHHVLIPLLDHLVSDGASHEVLNREIWTAYNQLRRGEEVKLPHLSVQFADYAVWQERTWNDWREQHESYWKAHLSDPPAIEFPLSQVSETTEAVIGRALHFPFGRSLSIRLQDLAEREHTLLQLVVMAVYVVAISRWCNQRDLLVHVVMHGRTGRVQLKHMIGWLASPLYLRVELTKTSRFIDVLRQVSDEYFSAFEHWDGDRLFGLFPELEANLFFNWWPKQRHHIRSKGIAGLTDQLRVQPFCVKWILPTTYYPFFSQTSAGIGMTVHFHGDSRASAALEALGQCVRSLAEEFTKDPNIGVCAGGSSPVVDYS